MSIVTEKNEHQQLKIKPGKERHDEESIKDLIKEHSQFDKKIFSNLKKIEDLTDEEKLGSLILLTMLKEKNVEH